MTQEALGQALGALLGNPWQKQVVSAAEQGRRAFVVEELFALAQALGVSVLYLVSPEVGEKLIMPNGKELAGTEAIKIVMGPRSGADEPVLRLLFSLQDDFNASLVQMREVLRILESQKTGLPSEGRADDA